MLQSAGQLPRAAVGGALLQHVWLQHVWLQHAVMAARRPGPLTVLVRLPGHGEAEFLAPAQAGVPHPARTPRATTETPKGPSFCAGQYVVPFRFLADKREFAPHQDTAQSMRPSLPVVVGFQCAQGPLVAAADHDVVQRAADIAARHIALLH